jgi:predicted nucleic acid-binding protein
VPPQGFLILDACVLIDFCEADESVLTLVSKHVGTIHIALPIFQEVDQLDESSARALGLHVVEPEVDMLEAAARKRGALSVQDHLCFLLAKEHGWTCVSNDTALRRVCTTENVPLLWGLEMMGLAVEAGALPAAAAEKIAWAIHEANHFVTQAVVERFIAKFIAPKK